ncbi:MAG: hypothetical protein J5J00_01920 [Deltaproteobacteria bacterium]|nr:hypothetical protein [Deltaproteobacteria bacterium]
MKRILTVVAIGALIAAAYYLISLQNGAGRLAFIPDKVDTSAARAALKADSFFGTVSEDTIFLLRVNVSGFSPLGELFRRLRQQLEASSAGKKMNIAEVEDVMLMQFKQGFWDRLKEKDESGIEMVPIMERILDFSSKITNVDFALSNKRAPAPEGAEMPMMYSRIEFSDPSAASSLSDMINTQLLQDQERYQKGLLTIEKRQPADYLINIDESPPIKALLKFGDNNMQLYAFTDDPQTFFPPEEEQRLVNSPSVVPLDYSFDKSGAIFAVFNGKKFFPLIKDIQQKLEGEQKEQLEEALNVIFQTQLSSVGLATWSQSFGDGMKSVQCVQVEPGSDMDKVYTLLIEGAGKSPPSGVTFIDAINDSTLFAIRFSGGALYGVLNGFASQYKNLSKFKDENIEPKTEEALNKLIELSQKLEQFVGGNDIYESGIRVQSVANAPMPEAALFISSRTKSASELLASIAATANDVALEVGGRQEKIAELSRDENGKEEVVVKALEAVSVHIVAAGDHSVRTLIKGPMLASAEDQAPSPSGPYLTTLPGFKGLLRGDPGSWDMYYFINFQRIFDSLKSYVPFLLMNQKSEPEKQLTVQDVNELLDIFGARVITAQASYSPEPQLFCFDSILKNLK